MYGIVRTGNGNYYTSMIFGFYGSENYSEDCYIILNHQKNALIKQSVINPDSQSLERMILIADCDGENWTGNAYLGFHGVDYLPEQIMTMIENNSVPDEILKCCIKEDSSYVFVEYPEIKTKRDIKNFYCVTDEFHDAYIKEIKQNGDMLHVRFAGTFNCETELWFNGDVEYDVSSRDPEKYDPYWFGSTVLLKDGFVYFADGRNLTTEEIEQGGYCWFKARNMKYHIIPD